MSGPDVESAESGPAAPESGAGLISDEVMIRASRAYLETYPLDETTILDVHALRAALAAVVPDLERAVRERARRECAEELRALHRPDGGIGGPGAICVECTMDFGTPAEDGVVWPCASAQLADSWSPVTEETPAEETT